MGLDLLITFVLTRYIFVVFLQKRIQTSLLKTSSRGCVRTPTLPVVLALCKILLLACYSEPELDPMWVLLWCITIAFLLLIIVCIECPPPRRFVRWLYHLLNKCVISLLGLIFVTHLSRYLCGDASVSLKRKHPVEVRGSKLVYLLYKVNHNIKKCRRKEGLHQTKCLM